MLQRLGAALVRADPLEESDVIVVLGGDGRSRAPHAADLFAAGLAPVVLAVGGLAARGEHAEAWKTARMLRLYGVPEALLEVLGEDEPHTAGEARAVARLAEARGWRRVIVVSSPYHCWRAGLIFDAVLGPLGVEVRLSPSPYDGFQAESWWRDARQRRQVRNELVGFAWWRLGLR